MDTKRRSWVKSITWRLFGILLLGAISYAITRDWTQMTVITILFHSIRLILYYFHERIWDSIDWGRIKHPLEGLPVTEELKPEDLEEVREKLRSLGYIE